MSDTPLDVLILWHMHQPYYKNLRTGRMAMPWTRLHGTKDYLDMVLLTGEFPGIHININWVPSLLDQILDYASGQAADDELDLSRAKPEDLGAPERIRLLQTHFSANRGTMIEPHRRYEELRRKRGNPSTDRGWRQALGRFSAQDLRDLQVWLNLVWIDPLLRERDSFFQDLLKKGRDFTEDEKRELLGKQRALLGEIIPATARAWSENRIEVSTTPYYHPILPLLWDTEFARRARPEIELPRQRFSHPEDAEAQIREGMDRAEELFGQRPKGMWPSEGSVCDEIIPALAGCGVEWIATDEEVLARSIGLKGFTRDEFGNVLETDELCRAYSRAREGKTVGLVFRDHAISDLIGFQLAGWPPQKAADALIQRLEEAQRRLEKKQGPHAISIILDGENCWEYYKNDGLDFLRAFYERLSKNERLRSATISEHLRRAGGVENLTPLKSLHSGSWINHDFKVWIGHPEDNASWELLAGARKTYEEQIASSPPPPPEAAARARQSLFVAEGSDWNWWYGDEHDSGNDPAFDALYREHLSNVYRFLGLEPPARLKRPILAPKKPKGFTAPRGFLSPKLDGRPTSYFEWFDAGTFDPSLGGGGAMHKAEQAFLGKFYVGFNLTALFFRIDLAEGRPWDKTPGVEASILIFGEKAWRIDIARSDSGVTARLRSEETGEDWSDDERPVQAAAEYIVELGVPFAYFGLKPGNEFGVQVELRRQGEEPERHPPQAPISLAAPDAGFEARMWMA